MTQKNAANGGVVASDVEHYDPWPLVQQLWAEAMGTEYKPFRPHCSCRTLSACPGTVVVVHEPECPHTEGGAYSLRQVAETLLRVAARHEHGGKLARAHELRRRAALLDVARLAIGEL